MARGVRLRGHAAQGVRQVRERPLPDGWYHRLRDAYLATMADLGVDADLSPVGFLAAMDGYQDHDPQLAIIVSAIKATVKSAL